MTITLALPPDPNHGIIYDNLHGTDWIAVMERWIGYNILEPTDEPYERWNCYQCLTCGKFVPTILAQKGSTPLMMTCKAGDGCDGSSHSAAFPLIVPVHLLVGRHRLESILPQYVWYMPSEKELDAMGKESAIYHRSGGLALATTTEAATILIARGY